MKKQDEISNLKKKKEEIKSLEEKLSSAKSIVFSDYHGLSSDQINELRAKIKEGGGELLVAKNTLLKIALSRKKFDSGDQNLNGPTATLLSFEDEVAPLKQVAQIIKTLGVPKYKFGFLGKDLLDASEIDSLSRIPNKEELQAKVVGALNFPIFGFVSVLSANLRNLVSVLDQAAKKGANSA